MWLASLVFQGPPHSAELVSALKSCPNAITISNACDMPRYNSGGAEETELKW